MARRTISNRSKARAQGHPEEGRRSGIDYSGFALPKTGRAKKPGPAIDYTTGLGCPKGRSRKDERKAEAKGDTQTRKKVRLEVIRLDGNRSRFSGAPLGPLTCHVHEIPSRALGGDPLDPACCIALTPREHPYFTRHYIEAVLTDKRRGTRGPIRFLLTPRGHELLASTDSRRAKQRETFRRIWEGRH
ncbi:hypothetical protein LCGC14_1241950 [marine sediment metagenome]|uniref:Uncharacterized protein n=1 Tax=marine sediment metagenome TaxID=412755 RepID=A0A0F9P9P6_9ZZZZ